ncbi:hypothetical protein ACFP1Z_06980 [Streptomyces gamaensis]|uniref:Secreted protein n=1 Tax=Streptomyces gamaensis TaxID=1763542 RepID=A0ABW0YWL2_9ACTN
MRRKTLVSASATAAAGALVLGAVLAGCGGSDREDYVATGAAGPGQERRTAGAVPPTGGVRLVPLERGTSAPAQHTPAPPTTSAGPGPSARTPAGSGGSPPPSPRPAPGTGSAPPGASAPVPPTSSARPPRQPSTPPSTPPSPTPSTPPSAPPPASPTASGGPPSGPAVFVVDGPRRAQDERRWCERVDVWFLNTGGTPAATGDVLLGTHIVDGLGIDWATVTTARPLPVPIGAGQAAEGNWTVCVDAWRVPPGFHVETRDVTVRDVTASGSD